MDDAEVQIPAWGELMERVEEEDGIGSAGDSDANALVGFEHVVVRDGGDDALEEHGFIVRGCSARQVINQAERISDVGSRKTQLVLDVQHGSVGCQVAVQQHI